jgi:hypothetical protein
MRARAIRAVCLLRQKGTRTYVRACARNMNAREKNKIKQTATVRRLRATGASMQQQHGEFGPWAGSVTIRAYVNGLSRVTDELLVFF